MVPMQKQPTFDWKAPDKYNKLCNFEIEVKMYFYQIIIKYKKSEKMPIIMKCLGRRTQPHPNIK